MRIHAVLAKIQQPSSLDSRMAKAEAYFSHEGPAPLNMLSNHTHHLLWRMTKSFGTAFPCQPVTISVLQKFDLER